MADERKPALGSIRSDALRALLDLRDEFPLFRQLLDDIIQIVMVLDASAVQGELRWRLRRRTKPAARTGLHEAIDAGVVIAYAPIFLKQEIEKHLPVVAIDTGVSIEVATAEWQRVQSLIRFYAPIGDSTKFAVVDPKDSEYVLTWQELDADFVRTGDYRHFARMGTTVIGPELDQVLRDYARSTSVLVTVKLGSGFALTFSVIAFIEMVKGITEIIRKLPPTVRLMLLIAVALVLLHPASREKLIRWAKTVRERLREAKPMLVPVLQEAAKYLDEAMTTSKRTREAISSRLPIRGKKTALDLARLICLRSSQALTADEIAQRILVNGYSSRSKTFPAYVRRLLREDRRFVTNSDGLWTLRIAA
jgi:hypothetical protein